MIQIVPSFLTRALPALNFKRMHSGRMFQKPKISFASNNSDLFLNTQYYHAKAKKIGKVYALIKSTKLEPPYGKPMEVITFWHRISYIHIESNFKLHGRMVQRY